MIKTIRTKNIKGNTIEQALTGKDIFIGPNGAGKSTRLQAVQLAMVGYIPGKGRTNQETFKLSSGDEMSAGIGLDSFSFDRLITRTEKLKGDGSKDIKYSESLTVSPNKGEKNATQMNSRVVSEVGSFPIVFDFQQFLDMSDTKRRDFIYSLSPITNDDWDKNKVSAHLSKKLLTPELKGANRDLYETTHELITQSLNEWPLGYDLSSGLQSMLAWVETQQRAWNKKQDDATGAVRELAEMKNKLEETDRDIVAKKDEIKQLRLDLTNVHGQIQAGQEIKRQWDQKQERISQLQDDIQKLVSKLEIPDENDYEVRVEDLRSRIKQSDISSESSEFQKRINAARFIRDEKLAELDEIKVKESKLTAELYTMNTVLKNIQEKGAGICVIHHQISCDKDFSKFTGHVTMNGPKLQIELDELIKKRIELSSEISLLKQEEDNLETGKRLLHQLFIQESKDNDQIRSEIEKIRVAAQTAQQSRLNDSNTQHLLQGELIRIKDEPAPTLAPLDILQPQFAALTSQINELERVIEEKEKAKITLLNSQTAMISASKARYYHAACKSIAEALGAKGIQGELVKSILGPIERSINQNLLLMGKQNPVFFSMESETGKEVFQFGWVNGERQTNFDVLSTGEQLLFLSAFLVTLLERANPPLKVLALDNIEHLDETNLCNLLSGLNEISHKLDNILIAGVVNPVESSGWKVWQL
ncbi:AAA family ATPase [Paenibacillus sp. 2RAB27]|uniref:hypothetical protein n=1 Tax=Paenibacillus sp. 2RAB27 TaxID=3232991 RepID=UPI003F9D94F7